MARNIANTFQEEVNKINQDGVKQVSKLMVYMSQTGFNAIPILKSVQEERFEELLKTKTDPRYQKI